MAQSVQNPGAIPRLAAINDVTGFGRCSICVALPVISVMKVQVCVIPTSILSKSPVTIHGYYPSKSILHFFVQNCKGNMRQNVLFYTFCVHMLL
jgi:pyridoxal/pyridoxine/pyridoxamine kinase